MILFMWRNRHDWCCSLDWTHAYKECTHQLALLWGTRHLISPELAEKDVIILLLLLVPAGLLLKASINRAITCELGQLSCDCTGSECPFTVAISSRRVACTPCLKAQMHRCVGMAFYIFTCIVMTLRCLRTLRRLVSILGLRLRRSYVVPLRQKPAGEDRADAPSLNIPFESQVPQSPASHPEANLEAAKDHQGSTAGQETDGESKPGSSAGPAQPHQAAASVSEMESTAEQQQQNNDSAPGSPAEGQVTSGRPSGCYMMPWTQSTYFHNLRTDSENKLPAL